VLLSLPECEGDFLITGQLHPHWNGVNPNSPPTAVPADGCIVACNSFEMPASVPPQSRSRRKLQFLEAEKIVCGTELGLRLPSALCPPSDRKNFEGYRVGCWVYRPPSDRQQIFLKMFLVPSWVYVYPRSSPFLWNVAYSPSPLVRGTNRTLKPTQDYGIVSPLVLNAPLI